MFEFEKYKINIEFKNRTNFLKVLSILFKNGYQSYIKIHQYSKGLEIEGTALRKHEVNQIIKILDKKLIQHLNLEIKIIKIDRRIIIKDGEKQITHI